MSAEFTGRVTAFYDFTNGRTLLTLPTDEYGHGTHVAGTIGGSGANSSNSGSYHGLAPKVKFAVFKVLDGTGAGYTSDVIRAIDFAVANRNILGIDIINLSLGHPIYEPAGTDPMVQAVERASQAGIVVVAAAGNYGKNPSTGFPDTPASRRQATPHLRLRPARSISRTRSHTATIVSPTTVRRVQPGMTRSSNPISSVPVRTSSPSPRRGVTSI